MLIIIKLEVYFIMSLHIYRNIIEVPSEIRVVQNNDLFFNVKTSILHTGLVLDILK